jgi:Glycosyl hydrolase family 63 C-terminal domain
MTAEEQRLEASRERREHWKRWGPYLSERAWGTVREDYSEFGTAWEYLPHDHARSRAYRWNEDGIAGICDRHQKICFALALWNGKDSILKERLFGLTGNEGNHGEDVKECYYYLDNTPTHTWMRYLYKYPQSAFPYAELVEENRRRGKTDCEYELLDTGIFDGGGYFDVFVEYAKAGVEEILIRITAWNRGPEAAALHIVPTVWFRNTWSWGLGDPKPHLKRCGGGENVIELNEPQYGKRWIWFDGSPRLLFTENETNYRRLFAYNGGSQYTKDGIGDFIVGGKSEAVNPAENGTKAAAHYQLTIASGESATVKVRFTNRESNSGAEAAEFDDVFALRRNEADEFYATVVPPGLSDDSRNVMRQAFAGLLWSKQFYHYIVSQWLDGDPSGPVPPEGHRHGRNEEWRHLYNADVISMPDKWEFPWYASWDLAFHCVSLALVDPDFAKEQLMLMVREWYMHPNGQFPAYELALSDVNPPVHAWAAWRVYKIEKKRRGTGDRTFLQRIFHKLILNFNWWVNRKDADGHNIFEGGFLGLDNIGVFDRNTPLPTGELIEQADGTGWMAMYCLNLLAIALELAHDDPAYEDVASKFWEHFLYIAAAMNNLGNDGTCMWSEEDGFFYDVLRKPGGKCLPMRVRSIVGLIPLFAVETLEPEILNRLPGFRRRMEWFIRNRQDLTKNVACMNSKREGERLLLSILNEQQLRRVLRIILDNEEFLSQYGVRSLSRYHKSSPFVVPINGGHFSVDYEPAESTSGMFGGNSNWRGPVWFPINFLIIESLQKLHHYYGNDFTVECPTGSGDYKTLWRVAADLSKRLTRIFLRMPDGTRAVHGTRSVYETDPHWRDLILFHEYFHGDNGSGLGASHQSGWTALVAKLIQQSGESGIAADH